MKPHAELTPKQEKVLKFIRERVGENLPPTIREIAGEMGFSSTGTVRGYLEALRKKGYLKRENYKSRAIELLDKRQPKQPAKPQQGFFKGFGSKEFARKREGIFGKVISGKNAQLTWVKLEPGQATDHKHNNEQIGYVLAGQIRITIGKESQVLGSGDAYCISANIRHGFEALGSRPAEYFEVFSPPKEENLDLI